MWIIGHRGAAGRYPENTLLSFREALRLEVDWIELDIRLVDGEIIVIHDDTLDRTTNGHGSVYQYRLSDLERFDAGRGEKIPTLREVLDFLDARCGLNIEIKQDGLVPQLRALVVEYLERQPRWHDRLLVSSFLPEPILEFQSELPSGCLIAALSNGTAADTLRFAHTIGAFSVNVSRQEVTREHVDEAHRLSLKLFVYTVNSTSDMKRCAALGADGIFTDYPDRAIGLLRR